MRRLEVMIVVAGALALVPTAAAFHLQGRSMQTVKRFALRRAEGFLKKYAGDSLYPPLVSCRKGPPEIWLCQVGERRNGCVVKLRILDEGPSGPPLYVTDISAVCPD